MFYHECIHLTPTLHSPLCKCRQSTWSKKPQVLSWTSVAILPASFLMLTLQLCPAKTRIMNKYCQTLPAVDGQRSSFIHRGSSLHVTSSVSFTSPYGFDLYFRCTSFHVEMTILWPESQSEPAPINTPCRIGWCGGWETYFHSITVPELTMVVSWWLAIY
jgi:hypothetical protein